MPNFPWQDIAQSPSKAIRVLNRRREELLQTDRDGTMALESKREWIALLVQRDNTVRQMIKTKNDNLLLEQLWCVKQSLKEIGTFSHSQTPPALKTALRVLNRELGVYLMDKPLRNSTEFLVPKDRVTSKKPQYKDKQTQFSTSDRPTPVLEQVLTRDVYDELQCASRGGGDGTVSTDIMSLNQDCREGLENGEVINELATQHQMSMDLNGHLPESDDSFVMNAPASRSESGSEMQQPVGHFQHQNNPILHTGVSIRESGGPIQPSADHLMPRDASPGYFRHPINRPDLLQDQTEATDLPAFALRQQFSQIRSMYRNNNPITSPVKAEIKEDNYASSDSVD